MRQFLFSTLSLLGALTFASGAFAQTSSPNLTPPTLTPSFPIVPPAPPLRIDEPVVATPQPSPVIPNPQQVPPK